MIGSGTRVGTPALRVPRVRDGSFSPSLLEPRKRALVATVREAYERALVYVQMARTEGIGSLVRQMPFEDRRRFFQAAFKSVTLDGQGRGRWRTRSVKGYELSDPLNTFILPRASA